MKNESTRWLPSSGPLAIKKSWLGNRAPVVFVPRLNFPPPVSPPQLAKQIPVLGRFKKVAKMILSVRIKITIVRCE